MTAKNDTGTILSDDFGAIPPILLLCENEWT